MARPPGPLDPRSFEFVDAFRRHQAELERRRALGIKPDNFVGHPDFAESLLPVWGSGREAIADFQEGDYLGAGINGAAAASDLFLLGAAGKTAGKVVLKGAELAGKTVAEHGGMEAVKAGLKQVGKDVSRVAKPAKVSPPFEYKRMRRLMDKYDFIPDGYQVHHWAVPQKGWGKNIPNIIKNNPLNYNPMPKQTHQLTHFNLPSQKLDRYGPLRCYMVATPTWAKVGTAGAGAHVAGAIKRPLDER